MAGDRNDQAAALRSIPLFESLDDRALDEVFECATEFEVAAGHVLAQVDQPGEGLFIIEDGTAVVDLHGEKLEMGPGEVVGELALLTDDSVHTGRVSAATPLRGLAIRRDDFDRLLEAQPRLAVSMLRAVAARLAARDRR